MQARYYDPVVGRFLSIDPVEFSPDRPDMFNHYAYVAGDPVSRRDPDGKCFWVCGIISGALEMGKQLMDNHGDFSKLDPGKIATEALIGALGGQIGKMISEGFMAARSIQFGKSALGGATEGAIAGGTGAASSELMQQQVENPGSVPDLGKAAEQGALGAILGGGAGAAKNAIANQALPKDALKPENFRNGLGPKIKNPTGNARLGAAVGQSIDGAGAVYGKMMEKPDPKEPRKPEKGEPGS